MIYREVGGSVQQLGSVSGTDATPISLTEDTHAQRIFLENVPITIEAGVTSLNTLQGDLTIVGAGTVIATTAGQIITISGADTAIGTGGSGYSQAFFNQTLVNVAHNLGTAVHATTIVGPDDKVLQGEIVFGPNSDILSFNQAQTGTAYVVAAGGTSNIDDINNISSGSIQIIGRGGVVVTTQGQTITVSGITTSGGYSQTFTNQNLVSVVHDLGDPTHATTVVDVTGKVISAEVVFGNNTDVVSFNENESGTVYVVAASNFAPIPELQATYDVGNGRINLSFGKPLVVSGSLPDDLDFQVIGSGTFSEGLSVSGSHVLTGGIGITDTVNFWAPVVSGGAQFLNTVTIKDGLITSWSQG